MFDLTELWVIIRKKPNLIWQLLFSVAVFALGWQLGKISSPYYASHPIIFQESGTSNLSENSNNNQELMDLKQEGIELRESKKTPGPSPSPSTEVAGVTVEKSKEPNPTQKNKFIGSVNSDLFHHPDCSSSKRIKEANQIWFSSIEEAELAGYSPSKCTIEKLGIGN
jgi:hypothetical protein